MVKKQFLIPVSTSGQPSEILSLGLLTNTEDNRLITDLIRLLKHIFEILLAKHPIREYQHKHV